MTTVRMVHSQQQFGSIEGLSISCLHCIELNAALLVEEMEQVLEGSPSVLSDPGILNSSEIVDAGIVSIAPVLDRFRMLNVFM